MFSKLSAPVLRQTYTHLLRAGRSVAPLFLPTLIGLSLFALHALDVALISRLNVYSAPATLERDLGLVIGLELVWWLGLTWLGYLSIHLLRKRGQA